MKKLVHYAQAALATAVTFGPVAALAQSRPIRGADLPVEGKAITGDSLLGLLSSVATFLIAASTILAVVVIVYGGVIWMTKGDAEGKKILFKGIIGVAIVLAVGVILSTVSGIVSTQDIG